jgi:hypothetical protein
MSWRDDPEPLATRALYAVAHRLLWLAAAWQELAGLRSGRLVITQYRDRCGARAGARG